MKTLLLSFTPFQHGGLNRAMRTLGPLLRERGHQVTYAAIGYDGAPHHEFEFDVWPVRPALTEDNNVEIDWAGVDAAVSACEPDRMVMLGDPWTFRMLPVWRRDRRQGGLSYPPALLWMTIDSGPFPDRLWQQGVLDFPEQLACTTMFGCRVLDGTAKYPWPLQQRMRYRSDYLPLGVDREVYFPKPASKSDDRLWVGWCGRNDNRKMAPTALRVLQLLKQRDVPAMLWMRTEANDCYDLPSIARDLGLRPTYDSPAHEPEADIYFLADRLAGAKPLSDAKMADFYRTCDVLLHTATAGAPELPILEARACGTPVVAPDAYSNPETADIVVPLSRQAWFVSQGPLHGNSDPEDYADGVLQAVEQGVGDKPVPTWDLTADALDLTLREPVPDGPIGMVI